MAVTWDDLTRPFVPWMWNNCSEGVSIMYFFQPSYFFDVKTSSHSLCWKYGVAKYGHHVLATCTCWFFAGDPNNDNAKKMYSFLVVSSISKKTSAQYNTTIAKFTAKALSPKFNYTKFTMSYIFFFPNLRLASWVCARSPWFIGQYISQELSITQRCYWRLPWTSQDLSTEQSTRQLLWQPSRTKSALMVSGTCDFSPFSFAPNPVSTKFRCFWPVLCYERKRCPRRLHPVRYDWFGQWWLFGTWLVLFWSRKHRWNKLGDCLMSGSAKGPSRRAGCR